MKTKLVSIQQLATQIRELQIALEKEIVTDFELLKEKVNEVRKANPDFVAPWDGNGTRRNYCVKNVGDAILEVLPNHKSNALILRDVVKAIESAVPKMGYSYNYVAGKITQYMNSEYVSQDGYYISQTMRNGKFAYFKSKIPNHFEPSHA